MQTRTHTLRSVFADLRQSFLQVSREVELRLCPEALTEPRGGTVSTAMIQGSKERTGFQSDGLFEEVFKFSDLFLIFFDLLFQIMHFLLEFPFVRAKDFLSPGHFLNLFVYLGLMLLDRITQ